MRAGIEAWTLAAPLVVLGLVALGSGVDAQTATPPPEPASLSLVVETDPAGFEGIPFVHVPGGIDAFDGTPGQVEAILDPFPDPLVDNPFGADIPAPSGEYLYPELAEAMSEPFTAPTTLSGLAPGRHSLVLARAPDEARPTSVRCAEQGERGLIRLDVSNTPSPRLATIELRPGDAIECTFSVDMRRLPGSLSVSASGDVPAGDEDPVFLVYFGSLADVPYEVVEALAGAEPVSGGDPTDIGWPSVPSSAAEPAEPGDPVAFLLPVGESRELLDLPTGPRTIMLTDLPDGLTVEAITCTGEPDTPVAITGNGPYDEPRVALVGITAANAVSCDFLLAATPPPEPASLSLVVETDPAGFEGIPFVHVPGGIDAFDGTPGQVEAILDPFPDPLVDNPFGADIPAPSGEYLYPELAEAMSEPFTAPTTLSGLAPGRHSLVLARAPDEARPTSVRCAEQGERGLIRLDVSNTPSPRLATIELRPGDAIECTFSVDMRRLPGSLSVSASGDVPAGDEDPVFLVYFGSLADVPYEVVEALAGAEPVSGGDPTDIGWPSVPSSAAEPAEPGDPVAFLLPVGESRELLDLPTGPRTIMLTDLPDGLTVEAITCTGEPDTPVAITGNGPYDEPRVALVGITAANAVSCDFLLAATPPPEPASLSLVVETDPAGFEGIPFVHVPGGIDAFDGTPGQVEAILDPFPDPLVDNPFGADIPAPSGEYLYPELAEAMSEPFTAPTTLSGLAPGRHSLVLARAPDEARPTSVRCAEQGERGLIRLDVSNTPSPRLATIELRPGDAIECTFSVDMRRLPGSLSVSASGDVPAGDEDPVFLVYFGSLADVPYEVVEALAGAEPVSGGDPTDIGWPSVPSSAAEPAEPGDPVAFLLPVGESRELLDLPTGPRTIMLTDLPDGLTVEAITCTGEPDTPVAITGNGPYDEPRVALVGITAANAVSCDFLLAAGDVSIGRGGSDASAGSDTPSKPDKDVTPTKEPKGVVPRAGRWNVVNLPASISCGGQTFNLPRTTDKGTVEVRRDGDRIIAEGIGEGRGKTVLDRVSDEPSVFGGKIRINEQGVDVTLNLSLEVPKRTRIAGTLSGKFNTGGISCKMSRDFTGKFAGK